MRLSLDSVLTTTGPNRDELMKDSVLDVLAELLIVPGELQGEAAGALRNLTLDGMDSHFHQLTQL